jgi:hypothetical protein
MMREGDWECRSLVSVFVCLMLFCFVVSCLPLSCLVLPCLALSCLVLSCRVLSWLVLSCPVLSCIVLSGLVSFFLALFNLAQSCHYFASVFFPAMVLAVVFILVLVYVFYINPIFVLCVSCLVFFFDFECSQCGNINFARRCLVFVVLSSSCLLFSTFNFAQRAECHRCHAPKGILSLS